MHTPTYGLSPELYAAWARTNNAALNQLPANALPPHVWHFPGCQSEPYRGSVNVMSVLGDAKAFFWHRVPKRYLELAPLRFSAASPAHC